RLDLSNRDEPGEFKWEELPPWPGPARVLPVAAAQHKGDIPYFYLFSGRNVHPDGSMDILSDAYRFNIKENKWEPLAKVGADNDGRSVMAASALPLGDAHIVVLGGDPGQALTERLKLGTKIDSLQNQMKTTSPGDQTGRIQQKIDSLNTALRQNLEKKNPFSSDILAYHTITNSWHKIGELPIHAPVTTHASSWDNKIILP